MNIQNLMALTNETGTSPLFQNSSKAGNVFMKEGDEIDTSTASTAAGEEFSTFLTLLTAQIRNQDPLAPLDSTQFVEQLATFSQLELQAKGNDVLEDIALMLAQNLYTTNTDTTDTDAPAPADAS